MDGFFLDGLPEFKPNTAVRQALSSDQLAAINREFAAAEQIELDGFDDFGEDLAQQILSGITADAPAAGAPALGAPISEHTLSQAAQRWARALHDADAELEHHATELQQDADQVLARALASIVQAHGLTNSQRMAHVRALSPALVVLSQHDFVAGTDGRMLPMVIDAPAAAAICQVCAKLLVGNTQSAPVSSEPNRALPEAATDASAQSALGAADSSTDTGDSHATVPLGELGDSIADARYLNDADLSAVVQLLSALLLHWASLSDMSQPFDRSLFSLALPQRLIELALERDDLVDPLVGGVQQDCAGALAALHVLLSAHLRPLPATTASSPVGVLQLLHDDPHAPDIGATLCRLLNKPRKSAVTVAVYSLCADLLSCPLFFSRPPTAYPCCSFFFTNDLTILVDISIRELTELTPSSPCFLPLLRMIGALVHGDSHAPAATAPPTDVQSSAYRVGDLVDVLAPLATAGVDSQCPPDTGDLVAHLLRAPPLLSELSRRADAQRKRQEAEDLRRREREEQEKLKQQQQREEERRRAEAESAALEAERRQRERERLQQEEAARRQQEEAARLQQEEAARLQQEEAARLQRQEAARLQQEEVEQRIPLPSFRALYSYQKQRDDELSLSPNERLLLVRKSTADWWYMRSLSAGAAEGLVPHNYVTPVTAVAKWPYEPRRPDELRFAAGDTLHLCARRDGGQTAGWVPAFVVGSGSAVAKLAPENYFGLTSL